MIAHGPVLPHVAAYVNHSSITTANLTLRLWLLNVEALAPLLVSCDD